MGSEVKPCFCLLFRFLQTRKYNERERECAKLNPSWAGHVGGHYLHRKRKHICSGSTHWLHNLHTSDLVWNSSTVPMFLCFSPISAWKQWYRVFYRVSHIKCVDLSAGGDHHMWLVSAQVSWPVLSTLISQNHFQSWKFSLNSWMFWRQQPFH